MKSKKIEEIESMYQADLSSQLGVLKKNLAEISKKINKGEKLDDLLNQYIESCCKGFAGWAIRQFLDNGTRHLLINGDETCIYNPIFIKRAKGQNDNEDDDNLYSSYEILNDISIESYGNTYLLIPFNIFDPKEFKNFLTNINKIKTLTIEFKYSSPRRAEVHIAESDLYEDKASRELKLISTKESITKNYCNENYTTKYFE